MSNNKDYERDKKETLPAETSSDDSAKLTTERKVVVVHHRHHEVRAAIISSYLNPLEYLIMSGQYY